MSINIENLKVSQSVREVREYISTPEGAIEIYEPMLSDIQAIIDLQKNEEVENGIVSYSGAVVIRELFPMLTNIDLGNLSDEELEDIVDNPSIHLLTAQQFITQIVAEANKLYAERIRTELMNAESAMSQMELMASIPDAVINNAKGKGKVGELVEKVDEASKALEEAMKNEQAKDNEVNA